MGARSAHEPSVSTFQSANIILLRTITRRLLALSRTLLILATCATREPIVCVMPRCTTVIVVVALLCATAFVVLLVGHAQGTSGRNEWPTWRDVGGRANVHG